MTSLLRLIFLGCMGIVTLYYGYEWLFNREGDIEAAITIIGGFTIIVEMSFSLIDKIFGSPEKPRLSMDEIGVNSGHSSTRPCLNSPKDSKGSYLGRVKNGIYEWDLHWSYSLFVRNNSNFHAFNPRLILKKRYNKVSFPGMNEYKPDRLAIMNESYVMSISYLHEKEPIKSGERYLIRIKYSETFQGTIDQRDKYLKTKYPKYMESFEVLFRLENGERKPYYTLLRLNNGKWVNKEYIYKPIKYYI